MTLVAIYDLAVSPTSYDRATSLSLADLELRHQGFIKGKGVAA